MPMEQTRSSTSRMPDGDTDQVDQPDHPGGSAQPGQPRRGGGGYPDGCSTTGPVSGADPRLSELEQIGLDERWLETARRIGVDAFLEAWRTLDQHTDEGRVCIPKFRAYERLQRNKAILQWRSDGVPKREIRKRVLRQYCERLSERHIDRILQGGTIGT